MASKTPITLMKGGFFVLLLFGVCFALTHFTKLALLGWKNNRPAPPPPEKEKAPTITPPEPVYYIVERKKSRAKAQYSAPKEIRFK